jgi:hypothetical protein
MSYISDLSQSQEYLSFRSSVPLKRLVVDTDNTKVVNKNAVYIHTQCMKICFSLRYGGYMTVALRQLNVH